MALKVAYKKDSEKPEPVQKLPMDKDPVFMAGLRSQIIADHNRKIRANRLKQNQ